MSPAAVADPQRLATGVGGRARRPRPWLRVLPETLLLSAAAVLGNYFSVSLFFGVEVLFGSIAALVALVRLGLVPGLVVAVAGGAYTLVLWQHPYALLIFALEVLAVGLHRRWARGRDKPPLAVSVLLYWGLIGMPLVLLFYHGPLGMPWLPTLLIAVKQSLNGILNAALAGGLLVLVALLQGRRRLPRLSELLFSLLLSALLLPSLLVSAWTNSDLKSHLEQDSAEELHQFGSLAARDLARVAGAGSAALAQELAALNTLADDTLREGAAPRLFLAQRDSGETTLGAAPPAGPVLRAARQGLVVVGPAQPRSSAMARWRASRYRLAVPVAGLVPAQDLVLDISTEPVIDTVQRRTVEVLAALFVLALGAVALASWLSRRIVAPVRAVADAARGLPAVLRDGRPWSPPPTGLFAEAVALGEDVHAMALSLRASFTALRRERDEQSGQRALLDLEAHCLAWLVCNGDDVAAFCETLCQQLRRVLPGQHCLLLPGADDRLELVASPGLAADARAELDRRLAAPAAMAFLQRVLAAGTPMAVPPAVMAAGGALPAGLCSGRAIPFCDREGVALGLLLTDVPATGPGTFAAEVFERVRPLAGLGLAALQLRREHGVLLEALSQSGTGIVVTRRSGGDHAVTYANRGFLEMTGYGAEALLGRDLRLLRDGDADQPDLAHLRAALAADRECRAVIRNRRPDGSVYWNALALSPVHRDGANVTHYIGVQQDVTDMVESTARLRASEARLNEAQAIAHLGHWEYAEDGTGHWSDEAYRLLGLTPGAVPASLERFYAAVHPQDRERVRACVDAARHPPQAIFDIEFRVCGGDGMERVLQARGRVQTDDDGRFQRFAGTALDVTERRRIEQALREQQARYRLVVDNLEDLVVRTDAQGRFEFASPSYCRMFGRSEEALIGRTFMPLVHPEDRDATAAAMARLFEPPHAVMVEQRAETVHGWRWLQWSDTALLDEQGEVIGIVALGRDITERQLAQQQLQESRERLDTIFEHAPIGMALLDGEYRVMMANRALAQLVGRSPEALLGSGGDLFAPTDDEPAARDWLAELIAGRGDGQRLLKAFTRPDGEVMWGDLRLVPLPAAGGAQPVLLAMVEDVTELRLTEARRAALESALARYASSLQELLDLVNQALPADAHVQALLRLARRALAMESATVVALPRAGGAPQVIAQADALPQPPPAVPQPLLEAARARAGWPVLWLGEHTGSAAAAGLGCCVALVLPTAGEDETEDLLLVLWGHQRASGLDDPLRQLLRLTGQRIVAVRSEARMQRDLVQAKERETIGHLTSGVAHDFNNLLGVLDVNLFFVESALADHASEDVELGQVLEETRSALGQAKVVTSGMLSLSRAGGVSLAPVRLAESIGELVSILRHMLPTGIVLQWHVPDVLRAWSNTAFLQAALLNLALNARDAMPRGGELRITAVPRPGQQLRGELLLGEPPDDDYIEVSVSDSGGGIPAEIRACMFEPLVSTKSSGRGHGLGLFMVKEFVLRSGAALSVETVLEQGTCFRLLLPTAAPAEPVAAGEAPATPAVAGADAPDAAAAPLRGLRVLVVDDDPRVRDATGRLLAMGGLEPAFAEHGEAALGLLGEDADFDLVLTDIAMPVMDGMALRERLREAYPELAVLMMTGQDASLRQTDGTGDAVILSKPLEREALYAAIEALCSPEPSVQER